MLLTEISETTRARIGVAILVAACLLVLCVPLAAFAAGPAAIPPPVHAVEVVGAGVEAAVAVAGAVDAAGAVAGALDAPRPVNVAKAASEVKDAVEAAGGKVRDGAGFVALAWAVSLFASRGLKRAKVKKGSRDLAVPIIAAVITGGAAMAMTGVLGPVAAAIAGGSYIVAKIIHNTSRRGETAREA